MVVKKWFLSARLPDRTVNVQIYYKESIDWAPVWPPDGPFLSSHGVSRNYNFLALLGFNIHQIQNYDAGTKMVNLGRTRYWLDTTTGNSLTFEKFLKSPAEGYIRKTLLLLPILLRFENSLDGKFLKDLWDTGLENLLAHETQFREIFSRGLSPRLARTYLDDYLSYIHSPRNEVEFTKY